jgi:hypothetical protein
METENESLHMQLNIVKQQNHEFEANIQDLKKQIKNYTDRTESDSVSVLKRVKLSEDRSRELQIGLNKKSQELEQAMELNRKLRNEYQNTRQDAEGMLQVMSGLEKQLNEYSSREEEVEQLARESKEKMEVILTIKEQVL